LEEVDTVFDLIDACGRRPKPRIGFDACGRRPKPRIGFDACGRRPKPRIGFDACGRRPRIGFDGPFGTEISPLVSVDGSEGSFGVVVETLFVEEFPSTVRVPNFYAMFV
jgi:hypothetical protein